MCIAGVPFAAVAALSSICISRLWVQPHSKGWCLFVAADVHEIVWYDTATTHLISRSLSVEAKLRTYRGVA